MSKPNQEIQKTLVNTIEQMERYWEGSGTIALVCDATHSILYINNELAKRIHIESENITTQASDAVFPVWFKNLLDKQEKEVCSSLKPVVFEEKIAVGNSFSSYSAVCFPIKNTRGEMIGTGLVGIPSKNATYADSQKTAALSPNGTAQTVPLSVVPTQPEMVNAISYEIGQSEKNGKPLSIVLINIDHLYDLNDKSKKMADDTIQTEFSELVKNHLRSADFFGKWDDAEFVLVLPDTNIVTAGQIAERIRQITEHHPFSNVPGITASFGVAQYDKGESVEDCIERADAAVFVSKMNGENRVEIDRAGISDLGLPDLKASDFLRLVWKREYECGHTIIDYQHRLMVSDANRLLSAMLESTPKKEITLKISKLLAHIQQHFDDEESILQKAGYNETEEHAMIHRQLIAKAARLSVRFEENKLDFGEIFNFLANDIVIEHILKTDKKYFPFLPQPLY